MGDSLYEIVGVVAAPFTGTETGTVTDVFVPTMMHAGAVKDDWTWHRTLARLNPGVALEPLRAPGRAGLVLGYANLPEPSAPHAVRALARALT